MPLDLTSVNAKTRRAESHLEALRRELLAWSDRKPYNFSKERSEDLTRHSFILHVTENPDFEEWSLIVGDCVHNLRSALEHLVYAIAVHESGQSPPPKEDRLAFPIADNPVDFKDASRRVGTLSDAVRAAIEIVQPYNRPHPSIPPPLAILRDFEKTDKHKLLSLAFAMPVRWDVKVSVPKESIGNPQQIMGTFKEIKDGTEFLAFVFDRPDADVDVQKIEIAVSLWHKQRDPSDPRCRNCTDATTLLTLMMKEIRFVVDTVVASVKM